MKYLFTGLLFFVFSGLLAQEEITQTEIKNHISYLASAKNKGRYPGTKESLRVAKYIRRDFQKSGIQPIGRTYLQPFEAKLRVKKGVDTPVVKTFNIIGLIRGNDSLLKHEYIVLGAHYDHLGMGGVSSKRPDTTAIHYGADDNASGVAALLEIAEKLAGNQRQLKRSIIVVAFGAEEQGLLGSAYFTEHPPVPLSQIKLMINMDMVGRLNAENQVYVNGAGTFSGGVGLMETLGRNQQLNPVVHAGGVGGSDHVSFYRKNISAMGVHTGAHPQYHTPDDTIALINLKGEKSICDLVYSAMMAIADRPEPITFIHQN